MGIALTEGPKIDVEIFKRCLYLCTLSYYE